MTTNAIPAYIASGTTVDTLSNRVEADDSGDFRYLVKITWEWSFDFYVIETPLNTEDAALLLELVRKTLPRDEGGHLEIITQF